MRIRMREELWILGFKWSIRPKTEKKSETTDSLRQESSWDKAKRAQSKKGQSYPTLFM